jgi:hypothetical protein
MKKLPAEEREIIPGAAYSTARLCSLIGNDGFDKLLTLGLTAKSPNGRDYWYFAKDVLAVMEKLETKKPTGKRSHTTTKQRLRLAKTEA